MNYRRTRVATSVAMMMAFAAPLALAQAQTASATIDFSGGTVAAGVGYTWGSGVLHFQGKDYAFSANGLSVVDVGVANIQGAGDVYNLSNISNFSGNYTEVSVGATVAGGGSVAALENQHGVIIHLHSTTQGLRLNLSTSGLAITLKQ